MMSVRTQQKAIANGNRSGLTKREHFAALALQGILAGPRALTFRLSCDIDRNASDVSVEAVAMADALLFALEKIEP